jgi:hypothetical protein
MWTARLISAITLFIHMMAFCDAADYTYRTFVGPTIDTAKHNATARADFSDSGATLYLVYIDEIQLTEIVYMSRLQNTSPDNYRGELI